MTYERNKFDIILYLSKQSREKIGELLNENPALVKDIVESPALDLCPQCAEAVVDSDSLWSSYIAERPDLGAVCNERCIKKIVKRHPMIIAHRSDLGKICDTDCVLEIANSKSGSMALMDRPDLIKICDRECILSLFKENTRRMCKEPIIKYKYRDLYEVFCDLKE